MGSAGLPENVWVVWNWVCGEDRAPGAAEAGRGGHRVTRAQSPPALACGVSAVPPARLVLQATAVVRARRLTLQRGAA